MATPTQPLSPADRDAVRPFLEADPAASAVVWDRLFQNPDFREAWVDRLPPTTVLGLARPDRAGQPTGVVLDGVDPEGAVDVARALPPGPIHFHLTEEWQLPLLEARASEMHARPAWLFVLDPEDFVDLRHHETRALTEEWASLVAKLWEPEWPAEPYVRRRIRDGPSFAVYENGKPVAWALTHLETDRVSMMGFLHVLEGHRGKGYAKSVGSALAKDILDRGKTPALHVYADNVASLELTPQLGFRRVKRQVWGEAVLR